MRDLNFLDSGCEPRRGPRAVLVATARRGLRRLLRPIFARLAEALESLAARLDQAETSIDATTTRLDSVAHFNTALHKRTDGLTAHLAGLNEEFLAVAAEVRKLQGSELRLESAEWNIAVLNKRTEGLAAHLAGLSDDHRALYAEVQSRIVQLSALSDSIANLGRRQDELGERFQAVHALHWDHVALARRLAAIEDLLSISTTDASRDARPSIPFPGLDDDARSRVG